MSGKRYLITILMVLALIIIPASHAIAATTADVTVTATLSHVAIADNATAYDFGNVVASSTTNTSTALVNIINTSSIQTDMTILVTTANWSGGVEWIHDNTGTPGADTAGLLANRGGAWGVGDVIVESTVTGTPNYIYENCPATTNFTYGLGLQAPTSGSDGVQKSIIVRVSAVAG